MSDVKKLLIYRMGSLGDTVVALPVFHMLAEKYANAERRDFGALNQLRHQIRDWGPDLVIYLNEPRGNLVQFRDIIFLKMCGARQILGVPATADLRTHRQNSELGLWEPEASRLARCVAEVGDVDLDSAESWSLNFTTAEEEGARKALSEWRGKDNFIAFSIGAKIDFKSWGDNRWADLLANISRANPQLGLAFLGGPNDGERSKQAAKGWTGPTLDLCGKLTPRESAVVMKEARVFWVMTVAPCIWPPALRRHLFAFSAPMPNPVSGFPVAHNTGSFIRACNGLAARRRQCGRLLGRPI